VSHDDSNTRLSLLERLQQDHTDELAWEEFVERYGRKIYRWCRQWGVQEADAQDLTQEVLLALSGQMSRFVYNPAGSFRAWLKTVAYRAWCRFLESRQRHGFVGGPDAQAVLESTAARDDLLRQLEEESDRALLELAMARVRRRVQPQTWEAFRLLALEGLSGAEVASRLDMKLGSAFMAKSNVQKLLKDEIRRLEP
jgi:RNA polymerase sigma-70 factor (ECF subfamily)